MTFNYDARTSHSSSQSVIFIRWSSLNISKKTDAISLWHIDMKCRIYNRILQQTVGLRIVILLNEQEKSQNQSVKFTSYFLFSYLLQVGNEEILLSQLIFSSDVAHYF